MENGYVAPIWMTFNQAKQLCANVRKGEHGSLVVFADRMTKTVQDEKGEDRAKERAARGRQDTG